MHKSMCVAATVCTAPSPATSQQYDPPTPNTHTHTHARTHALILVQLMVCAVFALANTFGKKYIFMFGYFGPLGLIPYHRLRPPLVNPPLGGLLAHT